MYCLPVLRAGRPKSSYQQGHAPSEVSKEEFSLAFSNLVCLWLFLAYGCIIPISASLFTWLFLYIFQMSL